MNYPQLERLIEIVATLRSENGCQWDREQTHQSLRPNMLEEAYEAVDAIDDNNIPNLREELGDVFLNASMIASMYEENDDFDIRYSEYHKSKVRQLILNKFIPNAFTEEELDLIIETELEECTDKVFIPSVMDIKHLSREERIRKVTPYAISNHASHYPVYSKKDLPLKYNGWYWTRTPYKPPYNPRNEREVWYVEYNGSLNARVTVGHDIGITPLIRLKLED